MTDEHIPTATPVAIRVAKASARPAPARSDPRKAELEANKLRKRLRRQVGEAIAAYGLIERDDRVMVCVSGGKDSHALLDVLLTLKDRAPFPFEVIAVNLDQKQPGFPADVLPRYFAERGIPYRIVEQDTYSVVKRVIPEGGTMCSLCSRLRRGALYRVASEIGATKIALGHHRDDVLATFFLNLFFGGTLKTMPPKLVSDDGRHVVIRPLVFVRERDLARYANLRAFPIIPCNLCGSQQHLQRRQVGEMLREWEKKHPGRIESIYNALAKVVPSHLMDRALFDFGAVRATGRIDPDGDLGFDADPPLERALAASEDAAGAADVDRLRALDPD
ncbi:MAG TPA: tRNA 2-thiocytidine(32) synthetase TtcA [Casimicrobiaceae bacterium]|nr:tRNA 2-thiocytidine(32) synthetase TtcA [Casimicrobiaceae bacterium]